MKKQTWLLILLGLFVVTLVWVGREHFTLGESTTAGSAKKSGYEDVLKEMGQTVDYQKAPTPGATQTTSTPASVSSAGATTQTSSSSAAPVTPSCPSGYRFENATCVSITESEPTADGCPGQIPGTFIRPNANGKCSTNAPPTCPSGYRFTQSFDRGTGQQTGSCVAQAGTPFQASTPTAVSTASAMTGTNTMGSTTASPFMTGTTTGGSSTNMLGSTAGGGGDRRKQVFGPTQNGRGDGGEVVPMDSSKTSQYPELLGGGDIKPSTLVDGAGVVPKDKSFGLPSFSGLGSDEMSQYFPTSRVPGDMEKIPDPYRVSQSFSAANYSFKTEPVPFLTDFSAFQK